MDPRLATLIPQKAVAAVPGEMRRRRPVRSVDSLSDARQQQSVDVLEVFVKGGESKSVPQGGGGKPQVIGRN